MHIVIAPDKFKGSLSGRQAAEAIHAGFLKVFPEATYELIPLADGGEGILDAFHQAAGGKLLETTVKDALGRDVSASWLLTGDRTAVIESAQANGLWRIAKDERNLSRASTFGVGQLIRAAVSAGARRIILGIGGSATNDAGLGLASALGHRFLDSTGTTLEPIPANIPRISRIDSSEKAFLPPITVACDVANPLLGPRGATRVYGPQKGLRPLQADEMESALAHLASLCQIHFLTDHTELPGAGAAGGLGFGLLTFCSATLESGFTCIANTLGAETKIAAADLVITAEGSLDSQTLEGKTPHGVSVLARRHGVPVYALAGCLADEHLLHEHFDGIGSIANAPMSLDHAINNATILLELAATRMARIIRSQAHKSACQTPPHTPILPPHQRA